MTGWKTLTIGESCDVVNGGTPKTGINEYWGGDNYWITPAEMGKRSTPYVGETERTLTSLGLESSSARLLPPNSVILSSRAPIGHLVINTVPMATNQGCKGLVPRNGLNHKFLYYYLGSIVDILDSLGTGATFREISGSKLKEVRVPFADPAEQQRVVDFLEDSFDAIAKARSNAEQNLQNARTIFESRLEAVFTHDSEELPLSDLTAEITDGDHMPPPKVPSGVPFITISDIVKKTREIDFRDTFAVPYHYFASLKPNKKPIVGDVLYTVTGSFGIPVLVKEQIDFCFQRHIALLRPAKGVNSRWLYYALLSPQVFRQASSLSTGAAQKTISLGVLRRIKVSKINLPDQVSIADELDALSERTRTLASIYQQKLAALDALKKSLLHEAFSGNL